MEPYGVLRMKWENAGMAENQLVSVLMPVRNGEQYLHHALESVLNQTYQNLEVIIVNDGSTDSTCDIIHSFHDPRIRLFDRNGHGITKSLNYGLKQCRGNFVARMDADDICYPERIERQMLEVLTRRADLVWCNATLIDDDGEYICHRYQPNENLTLKLLSKTNYIMHPGVLFRKATVDAAGGYDETFPYGQDVKLWKTLVAREASFALCDELLMDYRVSTKSVSYKNFRMPVNRAYRNALVCLKNRARQRFFHYFSDVCDTRAQAYLLIRYLFGETMIECLRGTLETMGLRGRNSAMNVRPSPVKNPGCEAPSGQKTDETRRNQLPTN
jgi:glycosyltransferase involved in cell wall biosynthesis